MCDINQENIHNEDENKTAIKPKQIEFNDFLLQNIDLNDCKSPSSSLSSPFFLNFSFKSFPSFDLIKNKQSQIKNKSLRFLKVSNNLNNKINLLEEIYDVPEYKKPRLINKATQCSLDLEAPYRNLGRLIATLDNDNLSLCDRTVHPAYSNEEEEEEEQTMDSSGLFKVPLTPNFTNDSFETIDKLNNHSTTIPVDQEYSQSAVPEMDSLFLEHEGSTYIRVDDSNYHLVQSISENGTVTTETGLQIIVPEGTEIPLHLSPPPQEQQQLPYQQQQQHYSDSLYSRDSRVAHSRKTQKNDVNPYFGKLNNIDNGNQVKLYSDYVALPLRPAPQTPFTLSTQLYTPELSISLTDQECELMLTIDSVKKREPQQQPLYYQIYSYKDQDRYSKATSEVWALLGEIESCPLPMFCTISIPSGFHKHYFALRSVDQLNRFSDWSNVVQVEVENTINNNNNISR